MIGDDEVRRMEGVFEGLGPPQANMKQLDVRYYAGFKFPSWMEESSFLSHLVRLGLFDCRNCRQLPTLGKLPSLTYLKILGFDAIERMGCEFFVGKEQSLFQRWNNLDSSSCLTGRSGNSKQKMEGLLYLCIVCSTYYFWHVTSWKSLPAVALGKIPSLKYLKIVASAAFKRV